MELYKTGNPVPSADMRDIFDDNRVQDRLLNGDDLEVVARTGDKLTSWKGMLKKNDDLINDTRQNLIPLSRQYMTLAEAQADIANIPNDSSTYIRSTDGTTLADEYINNNGLLTPTGRSMPSQKSLEEISTMIKSGGSDNLYEFTDNDDNLVAYINKEGQLVASLKDASGRIDERIDLVYSSLSKSFNSAIGFGEPLNLHEFKDSAGNVVAYINKEGFLVANLKDASGNIDSRFSAVYTEINKLITTSPASKNLYEFTDNNGSMIGRIDAMGRPIFGGVDILAAIDDAAQTGSSGQNLKLQNFGKPSGLIQVYITTSSSLPVAKGVMINAEMELHIDGDTLTTAVQMEVQGASSAGYPKKNWSFDFYTDATYSDSMDVKIGDVPPHDTWVFKSNWIDATHIRNAMSYNLWEQVVMSRRGYPKRDIDLSYIGKTGLASADTSAMGHPVLYPAALYVNGDFYGIGSFGIGKKRENYNLEKNVATQIQMDLGDWCQIANFETESPTLYEFKAPKTPTAETFSCIAAWNAFASSTGSEFAAGVDTHLFKCNAMDFILFVEFIRATDLAAGDRVKNFQFVTYDGVKWLFTPYDLDTVFGLSWNGSEISDNTEGKQIVYGEFWSRLKSVYADELPARYAELRSSGIFSVDNIYKLSRELTSKYSKEMYKDEQNKWATLPSVSITSIQQIMDWTKLRIAYLDNYFEYTE